MISILKIVIRTNTWSEYILVMVIQYSHDSPKCMIEVYKQRVYMISILKIVIRTNTWSEYILVTVIQYSHDSPKCMIEVYK